MVNFDHAHTPAPFAKPADVHHDVKPEVIQKPRMSMAERLAKKMAEQGIVDVAGESANTPEDDRVAALVKNVNEKHAGEATPVSDVPQGEVVVEAAPVEKPKTLSAEDTKILAEMPQGMRLPDMNPDQRRAYGEMMRINAERKKEKDVASAVVDRKFQASAVKQSSIIQLRQSLMGLADVPKGHAERELPPAKTGQEIYYPDTGEIMYVLSVNDFDGTMTLVRTQEDLAKAESMAEKSGISLREAGGKQTEITFAQCKDFLHQTPAAQQKILDYKTKFPEMTPLVQTKEEPAKILAANNVRHLQSRYDVAA